METMAQGKALTADWLGWIQDNKARGCTEESMAQAMVLQGFEHRQAVRFISQPTAVAKAPFEANPDSGNQRDSYVYEPSRIAAHGNVIRTPDRDVRVSFRMEKPVVMVLDDILSPAECDELIRLSRIKLTRSTVVDPLSGQNVLNPARTSNGTFFTLDENALIIQLEKRISAVMNLPVENGEGLQILHYGVGGEYKPHADYFPPQEAGSAVHLARGGQRVSTLVMYLNDVEQSGETIFPQVGLSVVPKKGAATYFEYCNSRQQIDPMTLHGGAPVAMGEKWIATKWMRQHRYG